MGRISAFVLLLALMLAVFLTCSDASPAIMRKPYYRPYHIRGVPWIPDSIESLEASNSFESNSNSVEHGRNKRDLTDTSRSVERDVDSVERQDSRDVSTEADDVTIEKNSVEKASAERSVENSREVPSVEDNTAEIDRSIESLEVPVGTRVKRQAPAPAPTTNTTTAKPTVFQSNERDDLIASVEDGTSAEDAAPVGKPAGTRVKRQAATPTTNSTTTAKPATFPDSNERDDLVASVEDGTSLEDTAPIGNPAGTRVKRQAATPTTNSTTTARPATFPESNERDDLVASVEDGTSLEDTAPVGKPAAAGPAVGKPATF